MEKYKKLNFYYEVKELHILEQDEVKEKTTFKNGTLTIKQTREMIPLKIILYKNTYSLRNLYNYMPSLLKGEEANISVLDRGYHWTSKIESGNSQIVQFLLTGIMPEEIGTIRLAKNFYEAFITNEYSF